MAPMRTHSPSIGTGRCSRPRILLRLGLALPLLPALAVAQVARRSTASGCRPAATPNAPSASARRAGCRPPAVDLQDGARPGSRAAPPAAMCRRPSAPAARACSGRRRRRPPGRSWRVTHSTRPSLNRPPMRHQHEADGAVAADEVLHAARPAPASMTSRFTGSRTITASLVHAQRRGRIDPVAVPARGAQLRIDLAWCSRRPGR